MTEINGRQLVQLPQYLDDEGRLTCPDCGCQHFSVEESRKWARGHKRRERECTHCGRRITTLEVVAEDQ